MLRIHQCNSAKYAKAYYTQGLNEAHDYYATTANRAGIWFGKAAAKLGLSGKVTKEQFFQLCDNRRPDDGNKLNPRENAFRKIGYDITFNAPKSVSLAQAILGDDRIIDVFQEAVRETMKYTEEQAYTRVRRSGVVDIRKTSNLLWAEFTHFESRPIEGLSDPQLHVHAYVFNTTHDPIEDRFKAADLMPIKRDAPYYEAIFQSRLAQHLKNLGYVIENKKNSFEIAGIGDGNIKRFSRRTEQIEQLAAELGIEGNGDAVAKLGAMSRESKKYRLHGEEKIAEWKSRFDWEEAANDNHSEQLRCITSSEALDLAIGNMLERRSVVPLRRLAADALQFSMGQCIFEEIVHEIRGRKDFVVSLVKGVHQVTTQGIIQEEKSILQKLETSKGQFFPLNPYYKCQSDLLDEDQRAAIESIMQSHDRVVAVEGKAGTGKTSMMSAAVRAIEEYGKTVYTFAPTSAAAHQVLKAEGFTNSNTIQHLLINPKLQQKLENNIMWIDEAGLVSVGEMNQLLRIAETQNTRVIVSGDRNQHHAVNRGDAMRLICESKLVTVKATRTVYRQRKDKYRNAVELISRDDVGQGLTLLDDMGAIREVADHVERAKEVAHEFVSSLGKDSSVLVVAPTHLESSLITNEIRNQLTRRKMLGCESIEIPVYRSRNLTQAELSMPHFYEVGSVIRFHRKTDCFKNGEIARLVGKTSSEILVAKDEDLEPVALDLAQSENFQLFHESKIEIAKGEQLRVTRNAVDLAGKPLYNGNVYKVTKLNNDGTIELDGRFNIKSDCGLFDYGYVSTSHSSQGKTADKVIVSQSVLSLGAAGKEQFYVSVSRGRDEVIIFTDDKEELKNTVSDSSRRMLAIELEAMSQREEEQDLEEEYEFEQFQEEELAQAMGY